MNEVKNIFNERHEMVRKISVMDAMTCSYTHIWCVCRTFDCVCVSYVHEYSTVCVCMIAFVVVEMELCGRLVWFLSCAKFDADDSSCFSVIFTEESEWNMIKN